MGGGMWWTVVPVGARLVERDTSAGWVRFEHDGRVWLVDLFTDELRTADDLDDLDG